MQNQAFFTSFSPIGYYSDNDFVMVVVKKNIKTKTKDVRERVRRKNVNGKPHSNFMYSNSHVFPSNRSKGSVDVLYSLLSKCGFLWSLMCLFTGMSPDLNNWEIFSDM